MPVKYIPYTPNTIAGQAILDNITRTQRSLRYRDNERVYECIKRGMPYYEVETIEQVGDPSKNMIIRGECISACAYLKEQDVKVDLIYIDPPFASGADYAKKVYIRRNPTLAKKIQHAEQHMDMGGLQAFEETMYGDIWKKEDYLNWMYENLHAIKSIMSDTASIYVHLDWHIGHYVKILMDEVFGEENFVNEIVWCYTGPTNQKMNFPRKHDNIYLYTNSERYIFNGDSIRLAYKASFTNVRGVYGKQDYNVDGQQARHNQGKIPEDWWNDMSNVSAFRNELLDYATQKPEALLQRIIKASSNEGMVVADFFGGSGVTAKVANDLGRTFIHCDVGINSIQTTRDRLIAAKSSFTIKEIQDGVNLFRNPQQTMDKLATLITGLQRTVEGVSTFWFGVISDSKLGTIPVFVPNLIDSEQKVLDIPTINTIINQEIQNLEIDVKKIIVYYIDIDDEKELTKFIKENNATIVDVELKDLKNLLHETVVNDEVMFSCNRVAVTTNNKSLFDADYAHELYEVRIARFTSDRLMQKIDAFNQKGEQQNVTDRKHPLITISEEGLELIELVSLDCKNTRGAWHSTAEIKIDKLGYVTLNGTASKTFWDGKICCDELPLRIKIRNICGDEIVESM